MVLVDAGGVDGLVGNDEAILAMIMVGVCWVLLSSVVPLVVVVVTRNS